MMSAKPRMHPLRSSADLMSDDLAVVMTDDHNCIHSIICQDGRTQYGRETIAEIRKSRPSARVMRFSDASKLIDNHLEAKYRLNEIEEVTEEQYAYALECLPPLHYTEGFFSMSERLYGNVTAMYGRIGNRYFRSNRELKKNMKDVYDTFRLGILSKFGV